MLQPNRIFRCTFYAIYLSAGGYTQAGADLLQGVWQVLAVEYVTGRFYHAIGGKGLLMATPAVVAP